MSDISATTLADLTEVFRDVFEDDEIVLSPSTSADEIEDWDSMMHVTLLLQVEKHFDVRFTTAEISSLKNVGELATLIDTKRG